MKSLNKVDMEGPYLNILKTICDELKANIILNSKKLQVFHLTSEIKQKSLFLPYLFNPILLSPSRSNQTRKRKKIHPNQKGKVKLIIICKCHTTMHGKPQTRSVAQSCPTLCNPMNHSTPGLPVHHQLPEFTETNVH